jgi:methyl-accepting chemotaxis protein
VDDQRQVLAPRLRAGEDVLALQQMLSRPLPRAAAWLAALDAVGRLQRKRAELACARAAAAVFHAEHLLDVLTDLAIFPGTLLGWLTTRSITGPLGEAMAVARRTRDGDLSTPIEIGALLATLRDMPASLQGVVSQVRGNAEGEVIDNT